MNNENDRIAVLYAFSLLNLANRTESAEEIAAIVSKLRDLYSETDCNEEIAKQYATGLLYYISAQNDNRAKLTLSKLEKLYSEWQNNEEIAELYAKGLYNLGARQESAEKLRIIVAELKELYDKWENSEEIALLYATGLFNIAVSQSEAGLPKETTETVAMLKELYGKWENSEEIAVLYAKGLSSLTFVQAEVGMQEGLTETVAMLKELYGKWENSEEIAVVYAMALHDKIAVLYNHPHFRIIDELTALRKRFPYNDEISKAYNIILPFVRMQIASAAPPTQHKTGQH